MPAMTGKTCNYYLACTRINLALPEERIFAIEFGFPKSPCNKQHDGKRGKTNRMLLRAYRISAVDTVL